MKRSARLALRRRPGLRCRGRAADPAGEPHTPRPPPRARPAGTPRPPAEPRREPDDEPDGGDVEPDVIAPERDQYLAAAPDDLQGDHGQAPGQEAPAIARQRLDQTAVNAQPRFDRDGTPAPNPEQHARH